jgi:hypothetical protein
MDRTPSESASAASPGNRFLWLFALPVGSSIASWCVLFLTDGGGPGTFAMAGCIPLLGVVGILAYKVLTLDQVLLVRYLPFFLAAVVYAGSMVDLAVAMSREPDGAFIPVLQLGIGFVLPLIALVCGVAGLVSTAPPRR